MMKKKNVLAKKGKDSVQKALSFRNKNEEITILSHLINADFVSEIKKSLEERKILDATLADEIGVSRSYISQIFSGTRMVNIQFITRIRRAFSIPLELKDTSRYFNSLTVILFDNKNKGIGNDKFDDYSNTIDIPYVPYNEQELVFKK